MIMQENFNDTSSLLRSRSMSRTFSITEEPLLQKRQRKAERTSSDGQLGSNNNIFTQLNTLSPRLHDRYSILDTVGIGAYGQVVKAKDK
jgi:hypothetical protein